MLKKLTVMVALGALLAGLSGVATSASAYADGSPSSASFGGPPGLDPTFTPAPDQGGPAESDANPPAAPHKLRQIQHKGIQDIVQRLETLRELNRQVRTDRHLAPADATALTALYSSDGTGLVALAHSLLADTDTTTAAADFEKIFTGFRIYALVVPQTTLVLNGDALVADLGPLNAAVTKAAAAIAAAQANGQDVTKAQADLAAAQAALAAATTTLAPVTGNASTTTPTPTPVTGNAGTTTPPAPVTGNASSGQSGFSAVVLALTPAGYPANRTTLQSASAGERSARADLESATDSLAKVRSDLQAGVGRRRHGKGSEGNKPVSFGTDQFGNGNGDGNGKGNGNGNGNGPAGSGGGGSGPGRGNPGGNGGGRGHGGGGNGGGNGGRGSGHNG